MIPRIQGKVGQADQTSDPEFRGKWFFTMWLSSIGGGEGSEIGQWGPFNTEEEAKIALKECAQIACEAAGEKMHGYIPGKYIDMKDNTLKSWKKK